MPKQHLKCEQLLKDTNAEYKRLIDALNGLYAISEDALSRIDSLIDDYISKN